MSSFELAAMAKLPKVVRSSINRNALRLVRTSAYLALRSELAQRACALMRRPNISIEEITRSLDVAEIVQMPAPVADCWPFPTVGPVPG